ncbi:ABC transporter permease [Neoactinobaculum massilliense]|uniref:ABC transporter permease n=1 Tax=Neoactinobaculum massilliense TaxID=2364794 RepID=UPI000F538225|nr:ABC transporter permease [Neoactinobaculum massilliense]
MKLRRWAPAFFLGVALILLWWALTASGTIAAGIVPNPVDVVRRIGTSFSAGYMLPAMLTTLGEAAAGCVIAAVVGIPVGYGLAKSPLFSRLVEPYVAVSQAVPAVAVAPLLVIWIGYGFAPITVLCAIMVIFPVIVSTSVGVRGIDHDVLGAARLDGASGWRMARSMEIPLAAPHVLAGLRTGFTLSITGAVVGEMVIGGSGLGMQLTTAQGGADVTGMFAVIILMAVLAAIIYALALMVERSISRKVGVDVA